MARGTKVWMNGKILSVEEARISLFTHALHYGTGAFEGIRAYKQKKGGGAVFRLREHTERFLDSLKILNLGVKYSLDDLCKATIETCKANGFEECYIRPIAYIGYGGMGLAHDECKINVSIAVWQWGE